VALSRDIVIRLQGDAASAIAAQKAAADAADVSVAAYRRAEREYSKQQAAMEAASRKQRAAMEDVGRSAAVAGAAIVAGLGLATKAAIDWESAWAGVTKTLPDGADFAATEAGLRNLARLLPATHTEIAAVAEAAGQLGVAAEDIVPFTKTMIDLGETTNLSADEAATAIAQMMNVMQTAPGDVERLGSTLVALGNAGASTEKQIIEMSQRISGAAAIVGLSEAEVLAFANAVASMGIEVESGGTSVSRVLTDMSKAAQTGGEELRVFAETAGMSAADFARAFREDPAEAFAAFIEGLGGVQEAGGNVFAVLEDLGLADVRVSQALLGMASSGDLLRESLDLGAQAWQENNALAEEAGKRYDTTAAKLEIARNGLNDAAIEIGNTFLPMLAEMAEGVADVAGWFADLPEPIQAVVGGLAAVAGVAGLAGGAFLLLFPRVIDTYKSFKTLKDVSPGVATGLSSVGKAAGVAATIIAVAQAADALAESLGPAPANMEQTTKALLEMGTSMQAVNDLFDEGNAGAGSAGLDGLADAAERLADPSLVNRFDDFTAEVLSLGGAEGRDQRERIIEQLDQVGQSLAFLVDSGNTELAAQQFELLADEWKRGGGTVEELRDLMPAYEEALAGIDNEQTLATESARTQSEQAALLAANLNVAYGSLGSYAEALGLSEEATEKLIEDSNALGESLGAFIDPLGAYTGMLEEKAAAEEDAARRSAEAAGKGADAWKDFVKDTGFSFDEYMRRLEEQVTAQANWQQNMLVLAGRVSEGTLAELARMGPEGAPLVADLVNRSDAELDRFDEITRLRSQEAMNAWGATLTMAAPVLTAIAEKLGQETANGAAQRLAAGTATIAQIAEEYGIALAGGLNPILTGLGRQAINIQRGRRAANGVGGFYEGGYTGPGGKYDPAGIVHAGEYVLTKEQTSRLGLDRIEAFANRGYATGGFVSTQSVPRPPSTAPFQYPISTPADASMERAYGDTVDWLKANLAPVLGPGIGWQAMMAALRGQFPGLALHSGFRPGSITATGNLSYHASGRAVDVPPRMDVFDWIHSNYGPATRELIFSPANGRQIWNGRPHIYSEPTRGDHWDHVHWAMANGGVIGEPVVGRGLRTGASYSFGERGPETVTPGLPVGRGATVLKVTVAAPDLRGLTIQGRMSVDGDGIATIAGQVVDQRLGDVYDTVHYAGG
jgi:TP901 family phage tail tape measure protein